MTDMVPMYGFGGGRSGGTVGVKVDTGSLVTLTKGDKTKSATVGSSGWAFFKGLDSGLWEIVATLNGQTVTDSIRVMLDQTIQLTYFAATINITYPAGLTCTATDGVTTLTAPDTSGTWACVVPNAGTWTVALSNGLAEIVTVADQGAATIDKWYLLKNGVANQTYKFGEGQLRTDELVTVASGDGAIVCTSSKSGTAGIGTTIPLSLAGFAKMSVEYNGNRRIYFSGYSKLGMSYGTIQKPPLGVTTTATSGIAEVDISDNAESWYIGVGWPSGSAAANVSISNLWLEA